MSLTVCPVEPNINNLKKSHDLVGFNVFWCISPSFIVFNQLETNKVHSFKTEQPFILWTEGSCLYSISVKHHHQY